MERNDIIEYALCKDYHQVIECSSSFRLHLRYPEIFIFLLEVVPSSMPMDFSSNIFLLFANVYIKKHKTTNKYYGL